jgi:hypothetical protein
VRSQGAAVESAAVRTETSKKSTKAEANKKGARK